MHSDQLNSGWITALGPKRVRTILHKRRADSPAWVREAYLDLIPTALSPLPTYTTTPAGNRFINSFAFLPRLAAGNKLIASHPSNLNHNNPRAQSLISLCVTEGPDERNAGRPYLVVDGAEITTTRTSLGALLLLSTIRSTSWINNSRVAFIGCGRLATSCVRHLADQFGQVREITAFDTNSERGNSFLNYASICFAKTPPVVQLSFTWMDAIQTADVVFFCTTETEPYCTSLETTKEDCVVLHLSLRDLASDVIAGAVNITDSIDHVCSNKTSLDRLANILGHRNFIRCTLTDLLRNQSLVENLPNNTRIVFSPFGLVALDIFFAYKVHEHFRGSWTASALVSRIRRWLGTLIRNLKLDNT